MATTKIRSSSILDGQVANADLSATVAVTGGQIADDAVTLAKMADGTQGDTLYYGAAGAPTLLAKPGTPADEVLTFATGATAPSWVAAASAGFHAISTPATGTGSWTKPAGVTKIIVEVQAGGGGGSAGNGTAWGGCGAGGAYAKKFIDVTSIDDADIVVGAAGAGGGSGATGTSGGTSSFICTGHSISCTGGANGQFGVAHGNGGIGGVATASGAFMLVNGQNGGQTYSYGDQGGDSFLGLGSMWPFYALGAAAPYPATGNGGGGVGGHGAHVSYTGAAGSVGIVIVWEYK